MNLKTASTIALWALHQQNPNDLSVSTELREREKESFAFWKQADVRDAELPDIREDRMQLRLDLGVPAWNQTNSYRS